MGENVERERGIGGTRRARCKGSQCGRPHGAKEKHGPRCSGATRAKSALSATDTRFRPLCRRTSPLHCRVRWGHSRSRASLCCGHSLAGAAREESATRSGGTLREAPPSKRPSFPSALSPPPVPVVRQPPWDASTAATALTSGKSRAPSPPASAGVEFFFSPPPSLLSQRDGLR